MNIKEIVKLLIGKLLKNKMGKSKYQKNVDWDDMSFGEASHHIGKKMTEKTHKSKKDYKRPKYKNDWETDLED
jgi:hypothetical protein